VLRRNRLHAALAGVAIAFGIPPSQAQQQWSQTDAICRIEQRAQSSANPSPCKSSVCASLPVAGIDLATHASLALFWYMGGRIKSGHGELLTG
jgi:hypothetical protein